MLRKVLSFNTLTDLPEDALVPHAVFNGEPPGADEPFFRDNCSFFTENFSEEVSARLLAIPAVIELLRKIGNEGLTLFVENQKIYLRKEKYCRFPPDTISVPFSVPLTELRETPILAIIEIFRSVLSRMVPTVTAPILSSWVKEVTSREKQKVWILGRKQPRKKLYSRKKKGNRLTSRFSKVMREAASSYMEHMGNQSLISGFILPIIVKEMQDLISLDESGKKFSSLFEVEHVLLYRELYIKFGDISKVNAVILRNKVARTQIIDRIFRNFVDDRSLDRSQRQSELGKIALIYRRNTRSKFPHVRGKLIDPLNSKNNRIANMTPKLPYSRTNWRAYYSEAITTESFNRPTASE